MGKDVKELDKDAVHVAKEEAKTLEKKEHVDQEAAKAKKDEDKEEKNKVEKEEQLEKKQERAAEKKNANDAKNAELKKDAKDTEKKIDGALAQEKKEVKKMDADVKK